MGNAPALSCGRQLRYNGAMAIIEFDNVSFSYGNEPALDGLSLRIDEGEFVCILGMNGSGKSTFARHVNALISPQAGAVSTLNLETGDPANRSRIRSNVGMVFQNPDDQLVATTVEDDVAFGPENLGLPSEEIRSRVTRALAQVGLAGFEKRDVSTLSGGQKQLVAIAGALAMQPRVLVLDEPTAMLDPRARSRVISVCEEANAAGTTIVLITHFLDETQKASRVVALDAGRVALDGTPARVLAQSARLEELGLLAPFARQRSGNARRTSANQGPSSAAPQTSGPLLQLRDVSHRYGSENPRQQSSPVFERLTLAVHEGEIVGVSGSTGSGKSTLLQIAGALMQPTGGNVTFHGIRLSNRSSMRAARREIGVAFQYPERQLFAATVFDDVAFGPQNQGLSESDVKQRVAEALAAVQLDFESLRERSPFSLSGGQQRRVALAGVLACQPRLLILDEPTAGLDPRSRFSFLQLIDRLNAEEGITVMIASHNREDLESLCDRIYDLETATLREPR